jgi:ATP-dependent Clp protease ATP-binding subunit ClpA
MARWRVNFRLYVAPIGYTNPFMSLIMHRLKIYLCESTPKQTMEILRGLKDALQSFHRVNILDEAIVGATMIATQFFAHKR